MAPSRSCGATPASRRAPTWWRPSVRRFISRIDAMLVIASRGSQLALWQARWVAGQLTAAGRECRIEIIKTTGDRITEAPLAQIGSKGLFTKEIEEALLDGRADVAVHSLKDLPAELPPGLVLGATPAREYSREAMGGQPHADCAAVARTASTAT